MSALVALALKNVVLALPLAVAAVATRCWLKRPALAHLFWTLVLIKLLTPPLVDVPVGWTVDPQAWLHSLSQAELVVEHTASDPRMLASGVDWGRTVICIWLGGSLLMTLLYFSRAWRFRHFVRQSAQRNHELPIRIAWLAAELGLVTSPRVVVVDGLVSPMLWGVGRCARIIFPAQLLARLSGAQVDSLVLHELAHYSRGDHYVRLLELVCHVLYWWNPLVWLARGQIETMEEQCCDAWVLQRQRGLRHCYAEALLTTIDFLSERPLLTAPAACGLGEVAMLKLRLTQIMREEPTPQLSPKVRAIVLVIGVLLAPLQPALSATSTPPPDQASIAGAENLSDDETQGPGFLDTAPAIHVGALLTQKRITAGIWSPEELALLIQPPLAHPPCALDVHGNDAGLLIAAWSGHAMIWSISGCELASVVDTAASQSYCSSISNPALKCLPGANTQAPASMDCSARRPASGSH